MLNIVSSFIDEREQKYRMLGPKLKPFFHNTFFSVVSLSVKFIPVATLSLINQNPYLEDIINIVQIKNYEEICALCYLHARADC